MMSGWQVRVIVTLWVIGTGAIWYFVGDKIGYRRGHDAAMCEVVTELRKRGLADKDFAKDVCPAGEIDKRVEVRR